LRLSTHRRLFEHAEDRRVSGIIPGLITGNHTSLVLRTAQPWFAPLFLITASPCESSPGSELSFKLFSESRWVNLIPSNPTQQAFVKCRLLLYMGLFNRKQNCAGMIEKERARERERERVLISWENVQRLLEENYLELIKTCVCFCNCGCCIEWV
jgi:hypothetical protein